MCAMFLPELAAFASAMLFAVHPIHTEAVSVYKLMLLINFNYIIINYCWNYFNEDSITNISRMYIRV